MEEVVAYLKYPRICLKRRGKTTKLSSHLQPVPGTSKIYSRLANHSTVTFRVNTHQQGGQQNDGKCSFPVTDTKMLNCNDDYGDGDGGETAVIGTV